MIGFLGISGNKRDFPIYPGRIFGMRKKPTSVGKIGESLRWGQFNILENNVDKYPNTLKVRGGDGDIISGEFGLATL